MSFATFVLILTALAAVAGVSLTNRNAKSAGFVLTGIFAGLLTLYGAALAFIHNGFTAYYISEQGWVCRQVDDLSVSPDCFTVVGGKYFARFYETASDRYPISPDQQPLIPKSVSLLFVLGLNGFLPLVAFSVSGLIRRGFSKKKPPTQKVNQKGLRTAGGLGVTNSYSSREREELPQPTDTCAVTQSSARQRDYPCGHTGPKWFVISLYGIETEKSHRFEKCPQCMIKEMVAATIRCALCGLPIFPGSGVALYDVGGGDLRLDIATKVGDDQVIGCMRTDCCPSGGFYAGVWTGKEFKSAFGGASAAQQAWNTGQVVASDIGDSA